ncbi:MAG: hypothetical protein LBR45_01405 [Bacteroidales bacterium]|nr:hypothetical protein [Bacteroidales bacterium]
MKQKIQDQKHIYKIGRLNQPIAKIIHRKAADIYITQNCIKHIFIKHAQQLDSIGYTPLEFVEMLIKNYNRIYKGTGNSLLLTKWNGLPEIVAIELNFALKKEFYEVKTAFIKRKGDFKEADLLWQKK